ncbi:MAG: cupin domain-containing protein [Candidatus Aenigmarchaeota archaeon]|nr:cupin domain-containing protein [Candidatus Aenigmarchaeota archaeon]
MKFSMKDGHKFGWKGIDGIGLTHDIKNGHVSYVKVSGRHGKIKTMHEDRFYYVIDGKGKFWVGDEMYEVIKGDVIFVPKKTPYDFEGKMEAVMFFTPCFDPTKEVKLE